MKYFRIILLTISMIGLWALNGYADRLYTWTDDKGVTHISQQPPPKNAKLKFTTDYTPRPVKPKQAVQKQEEKPKPIEPDKRKIEASKDLESEIYYDGGGTDPRYRRKKRKERREERREEVSPEETSEKVKRKRRSRGSRK
jgi:hypothetical protein